jgi:putative ABC transport system permease protein
LPRTPLAWANLTHDKVRFALFVLGIAFAVVLMFVQLGFRNALLDSNTQLHDKLRCDLVLVSPNRQAIAMAETFPRERLDQARVTGVAEVHPMYIDNAFGRLRDASPNEADRGPSRGVRSIGVDPDAHLLDLPELHPRSATADALRTPNTLLFDRRTKRDPDRPGQTLYGPLAVGAETELSQHRVRVVGSFTLGTDFTSDGTLVMSDRTFLDILRRPYSLSASSAVRVDLGLIRLAPGADPQRVKEAIRGELTGGGRAPDPDVEVLTVEELKEREKTFWLNNTPIGFAFGFGTFMGFAVGVVICYQILSGDVTDHLPQYATLKAVGYGNGYLAWVVLQESLILAALGFAVGLGVSWAAYEALAASTGMPLRMTADRVAWVLVATVTMCAASGLIALIGLLRADPADVF